MDHNLSMSATDDDRKVPVLLVIGTRPEAIKMVPLVLAFRGSDSFVPVVISTGQHHDMVKEILRLAGIEPDVDLWVGDFRTRLNERVATVMQRFEDFCNTRFRIDGQRFATTQEWRSGRVPVATMVHGDTSSAFAAALASFHLRIPVTHVEAGLRTGGLNLTPFPEELNRRLISEIAAFHLAPTERNEENLVREGVPADRIFVTGNTGIDTLHWAAGLDQPFEDPRVAEAYDSDDPIVVVTAHRRENWGGGLAQIGEGVARVARSHPDARFVVSVHPNPRVRAELAPPLEGLANALLTKPIAYVGFARLLKRCHFVITDSGGIQEEAPSLGKPVLVARDTTERLEGVEAGTLRLVGADSDRIATEAERLFDDPEAYARMAEAHNPYGDGKASERIVAAYEHLAIGGDPPQRFGPDYSRLAVYTASGYELDLDSAELRPQTEDEEAEEARQKIWKR
jgi:UDP-N-acetylglucosamine 2-epimerase (non-hydrolysing)